MVLLPGDDQERFIRFARKLVHAHDPRDILEEEQVRTIIETSWQLRRLTPIKSKCEQLIFRLGVLAGMEAKLNEFGLHGNS
jgi:hypothetical protein